MTMPEHRLSRKPRRRHERLYLLLGAALALSGGTATWSQTPAPATPGYSYPPAAQTGSVPSGYAPAGGFVAPAAAYVPQPQNYVPTAALTPAAGSNGYAPPGYTAGQPNYATGQQGYFPGQQGYSTAQQGYSTGQQGYGSVVPPTTTYPALAQRPALPTPANMPGPQALPAPSMAPAPTMPQPQFAPQPYPQQMMVPSPYPAQGPMGDPSARSAPGVMFTPAPNTAPPEPKPFTMQNVPAPENASLPVRQKVDTYIGDIIDPEVKLELVTRKSRLVRTKSPVVKVSITDPAFLEIVQFGPTEFELIGRTPGETTMTLWFVGPTQGGYQPNIRYLVRVTRDEQEDDQARVEYGALQRRINELFPNSYVQLIPALDKLIVRGQARDAREASQIMSIIRDQSVDQTGATLGPGSFYGFGGAGAGRGTGINQGRVGNRFGANDLASTSVINLLEIPGEQQVLLKVRVAELTRAALREMGANFTGRAGDWTFNSVLNIAGAGSIVLTDNDVQLTLSAISSNRTSKVLAEPNLVTLSGYPASFIAGGQFAVPTAIVGAAGGLAATTAFQGYGTQVQFTPTVLDKDHIRLQVTPTFSTINSGNTVNNIPGLSTRSVTTTVDLREGQWIAIAGLLQDQQGGEKVRIPLLGDIPVVGALFSRTLVTRDETELVILVSPELIHPMEPDQVPLILPGMEVTEPDGAAFWLRQRYEGNPDVNFRSTVWPQFQADNFDSRLSAWRQAKSSTGYQRTERYYLKGPSGFSN